MDAGEAAAAVALDAGATSAAAVDAGAAAVANPHVLQAVVFVLRVKLLLVLFQV